MNSTFRAPEGAPIDHAAGSAGHVHPPMPQHAAVPAMRRERISYGDALRSVGPKYAPHNANAPILTGIDVVGLVAAVTITLGPLAAYSLGLGA